MIEKMYIDKSLFRVAKQNVLHVCIHLFRIEKLMMLEMLHSWHLRVADIIGTFSLKKGVYTLYKALIQCLISFILLA